MRMYKEFVDNVGVGNPYDQCPVVTPTGVAVFPYEAVRIPEPWLHYRYKNLVSYTDMTDGGHFAAMEQPRLLADDIRQFVRKVENM
ncbi:putative epoxide hydrolase 1-like [Apostichopus japonicus]|uniref:Putative epoxide hydrolase 1-like n=2 Tax=Stichopus japonicus TaxID=307972 RepID=A0A2G8L4W4_STIJA|nr:putative epoxide hydrolase 1-like [Apostichopus japonicus]